MIGLGCMRLSTEPERAQAPAVLAAALAHGVALLDTSDAYCHDATEVGHNEQLIAAAVAQAGARVELVTKGGLTRPGGAWVADGRARHLAAAARASRDRLGVDAIDLYLLHAIDPRTPLTTSVRALARLRDDGIVRGIGLSGVSLTQLEQALAITPIDAVEVELQPWKLDAVRSGLVAACSDRGIRVLAHRPLGGAAGVRRATRDPVIAEIARRHDATPPEVVLAWLRSLSPSIVVLPGATRVETAISALRGQRLVLDDEARAALAARLLAVGDAPAMGKRGGEVVLIVGMPAAGKSTLAAEHVARGYTRLNRDDRGGSLLELARALDRELAGGAERVVLDNTYATRASRAAVIEIARRHGAVVRCMTVTTPIERAQVHAITRILDRHGRLLEPAELAAAREIGPGAQFRYRRDLEPPRLDEGFASLEDFVPAALPRGRHRALVLELDGVVWTGRPSAAAAIALVPGVVDALAAWSDFVLAATLWRPGVAPAEIAALAARLGTLLGRPIELRSCPHPAGPPICWCRKPLPGLALALARDLDLDLTRSIHVGRSPADRTFATRAGMELRSGLAAP